MQIPRFELLDVFECTLKKGHNPTVKEMDRLYGPLDEDVKGELTTIKMLYLSKKSFVYTDEMKLKDKKIQLFSLAMDEYYTSWWHPIRKLGLLFHIMDLLDEISKLELKIKNNRTQMAQIDMD